MKTHIVLGAIVLSIAAGALIVREKIREVHSSRMAVHNEIEKAKDFCLTLQDPNVRQDCLSRMPKSSTDSDGRKIASP